MKQVKEYIKIFVAFFIALSLNSPDSLEAQKGQKIFRAGAATSNITPFLGGGLVGNFGTPPPALYVHDELHCRCLVLDDGETKLAFVIVDNIGMDRRLIDAAKNLINKETELPVSNIMVSAIHTHSSVSSQGPNEKRTGWNEEEFDYYQSFLIRRIVDVVRIALINLEPARIGWGAGNVPQHVFVRRYKMKPGTPTPDPFGGQDKVVMNPGVGNPNVLEPNAKPDPEVSFISVQSISGRPIALLANYSLHYVGGVPANHISGDYFAMFADIIQERLKADRQEPPFVAIMSNGTSGNVNNINVLGPPEKNPPYVKMRRVADDVANEVLRVHGTIRYNDWVPLKAAQEELSLMSRKPDEKLIARAKMVLARPDTVKPVHRHEVAYAQRTLQMLEWPEKVDVILQAFRIGDLGVAAIPFETFAQTGLEIKEKSPFKQTFTIELANGSYGYLPTPEEHAVGGYETWLGTSRVEIEASRKIVAKLLALFAKME